MLFLRSVYWTSLHHCQTAIETHVWTMLLWRFLLSCVYLCTFVIKVSEHFLYSTIDLMLDSFTMFVMYILYILLSETSIPVLSWSITFVSSYVIPVWDSQAKFTVSPRLRFALGLQLHDHPNFANATNTDTFRNVLPFSVVTAPEQSPH